MSLQLRLDNPYAGAQVTQFPDGTLALDRVKIPYVKSPNDEIHMVTDSDNLSDLAYRKYTDSKWWWLIADVNEIDDPFDLSDYVGLTIILPDLNQYQALLS